MQPGRLKFKPRSSAAKEIELYSPETHNVRSGIFPIIREILDDQSVSVLDLGPPTSKKYRYLCGSGARVYWDNTPESISNAFHGSGVADVSGMIRNWGPPELDGPLGLILAWNYFDYLNLDDLQIWFNKISESVAVGSRVYFLIHHSSHLPHRPPLFDVEPDDMLLYDTQSSDRLAPRHPPKQLEQMMPGFEIEKLFLMSNGLQEHLFYKKR